MRPDITISVASFNTRDLLRNCLDSIYRHAGDLQIEVIVVDNASKDGSPEMVEASDRPVILIRNRRNEGFGKAHNQAFRRSNGRYFLILNSDAQLHEGSLREMLGFMERNPDAGIAGGKTFLDPATTFLFPKHAVPGIGNYLMLYADIGRRFPRSPLCFRFWNESYPFWSASRPLEVDGVDGGAMLIRRETFEETGGFDPNFFMFFEEDDLFLRARKKGWKIWYLPQASVSHYHAGSHRNENVAEIVSRSRRYYFLKHYGAIGWGAVRTSEFLYGSLTALMNRLGPKPDRPNSEEFVLFEERGTLSIPIPKRRQGDRHFIEISTNDAFSPRAGARVSGDVFVFTKDMLRRFVADHFYWRVVSVSEAGRLKEIVDEGKVLIRRSR